MNYRNVKTMMLALICMAAVLFPTFETEAAELSDLVNAGIASAIEQVDDETVLAAAVAPSVVEGYNLLGVVTAESGYINIREEMSTESKIVGKIRKNGICEVVSIEDEWSEIESGEIKGYISNEYLLTGVKANEKAEELMAEGKSLETAVTLMEYRYGKGVTDIQVEICEYARQFVGNPYKWGGVSVIHFVYDKKPWNYSWTAFIRRMLKFNAFYLLLFVQGLKSTPFKINTCLSVGYSNL